jgi:hypothetical protein
MTVVTGFKLVRLVWATLALMSCTVIAALVTIAVYEQSARDDREALAAFVCAAVQIQEDLGSPAIGALYRQRFDEILAHYGEDPCTTTRR